MIVLIWILASIATVISMVVVEHFFPRKHFLITWANQLDEAAGGPVMVFLMLFWPVTLTILILPVLWWVLVVIWTKTRAIARAAQIKEEAHEAE